MSSSQAWVKPFMAGVVVTAAVAHVIPNLVKKMTSKPKPKPKKKMDFQNNAPTTSSEVVMDHPNLDNRILRKAEAALRLRTSRLIIVVERCTNDHNYSAILRTAEALGVQHVYIIAPQDRNSTLRINGDIQIGVNAVGDEENSKVNLSENVKLHRSNGTAVKRYTEAEVKDRANHHLFAQRALEWIEVTEFDTTKECIDSLREDDYKIWSTDLSQVAVTLDEDGLRDEGCEGNIIPERLAIVFGTEAVGCSTQILDASDKRVYLPLRGFADSLNLSVATALVVQHLFILDPTLVGAMPKDELITLRRKWYVKLATQRILLKSDKMKRKRLGGQIKALEELEHRKKYPESHSHPLSKEQLEKLAKLPSVVKELKELEDEVYKKALSAVEDLVINPPEPIGDMRRADEHRITYTGKNTKKKGGEAWANMPATRYVKVEADTASFFRDRVKTTK